MIALPHKANHFARFLLCIAKLFVFFALYSKTLGLSAVGLDEGGDGQSHGRIVGVGVWSACLDAQGIFTAVLFVGDGDCTLG